MPEPAVGGLLGDMNPRLPFWGVAVLALLVAALLLSLRVSRPAPALNEPAG